MSLFRRVVWLPCALLLFVGSVSSAQAADSFSVYYGYWNSDDADGASGIALKTTYEILLPQLQVEARAGYYPDLQLDGFGSGEVTAVPLELGGAFHILPGFFLDPYVGAGGGYYLLEGQDADSEFGVYGVLGVELGLPTNVSLGAELLYRELDESSVNSDFSSEDFDASGITLHVGLSFSF